jgi:HTH-type transcriptional regulator, sugar sensing transcriptional regulator
MADATTLLHRLGFTEYEARTYIALLQQNPANGYELAKNSGIRRADIYRVLDQLEQRGAVIRVESESGSKYTPLTPDELLARLTRSTQETLVQARESLMQLPKPVEYDYVGNVRGYPAVIDHARSLIESANQQVLVALWPNEAAALAPEFANAQNRGVEITTLCLAACTKECGFCRGRVYRYQVTDEQQRRWLTLVPDNREVLTGEIGPDGDALAVRTSQHLLVEMASWFIRHSIALAAVISDIGDELTKIIRPETSAVLAAVGPGGQSDGWLEHMRKLLKLSRRVIDER